MDEVKLSQTPSPELDEEYQTRRDDKEDERNARRRHKGEDLIWRTRLEMEEYTLNQRTRQLDIHEAHLHRHECICDRREVEVHAARMRGLGVGMGRGSQ
jgi:hypothetical protein